MSKATTITAGVMHYNMEAYGENPDGFPDEQSM